MHDEPIIKQKPRASSGNRMQLHMIIFLVVAIGILVAVPYYVLSGLGDDDYTLRSYRYALVQTRTFVRRLTASGIVRPGVVQAVTSQSPGIIEGIYVEAGVDVMEGDLLMSIDVSELQSQLEEAMDDIIVARNRASELELNHRIKEREVNQTLDTLEDTLAEAKEDLELKEKLYELGTIPRQELENARNTVEDTLNDLETKPEALALELEKVEIDLKSARDDLARTERVYEDIQSQIGASSVHAPFSGRITGIDVEVGKEVQRGQSLFDVADINTSRVSLSLSESDVARIAEGWEGSIRVGGVILPGTVTYISPEITHGSDGAAVEVHVALQEIPGNLRLGATATVEFQFERRENIPYLPRGAYLTSGEYSFVYVIDGDTAVRRDVSFGQHDGDFIEVISGLEVGEEIITTSYEEFKDKPEITVITGGGRLH